MDALYHKIMLYNSHPIADILRRELKIYQYFVNNPRDYMSDDDEMEPFITYLHTHPDCEGFTFKYVCKRFEKRSECQPIIYIQHIIW